MYCIQTILHELPEVWFCEACQSLNDIVSPKSDVEKYCSNAPMPNSSGIVRRENKYLNALISSKMVHHDSLLSAGPRRIPREQDMQISKRQKTLCANISSGSQGSHKVADTSETASLRTGKPVAHPFPRNNISKKVETGKVKFLPAEDVLALTSGAKLKTCVKQGGSCSQAGSFTTVNSSISKRTPAVSVNGSPNSFNRKGSAYVRHTKPLTFGYVQTHTSPQQGAVKSFQSLHGKSPLGFPQRTSISESLRNRHKEENKPSTQLTSLKSEPSFRTKTRRIDAELRHSVPNHIACTECDVKEEKSNEPQLLGLDKSAGNEAPFESNEYVCEEGELLGLDKSAGNEAPVESNEYVCEEGELVDLDQSAGDEATVATNEYVCEEGELFGLNKSSGNEAPVTPNDNVCKKEPLDASVLPNVGTSNSEILSKFGEELPKHLAIEAIWKGSFEILDAISPGELYDGFRAHPPGILSRKAYDFSKQLPGILQFELQPRCDLWPDIFHMDSPTGDDIALYFFPGDFESSKQKYNFLLEVIEMRDLAMRSCLGCVELLLFTSKQLPVDSQMLNKQFYLWGVYRSMKGQLSSLSHKGNQGRIHVTSPKPRNGSGALASNGDDAAVLNMEIDVEGSKGVERIDKPTQGLVLEENKVQFNSYSQKGKSIIANYLYENSDKLHKGGHGSSSGATGSRDRAVGSSQNVCSKVHSHQPIENTISLRPSLEVKIDAPTAFSIPITSDTARKGSMGKSVVTMLPVLFKPKERDYSPEAVHKKKKALMVDVNATTPLKMENESFDSASRGSFMGSSLQRQKPLKGLESPKVSWKFRQVVSHGLSMNSIGTDRTLVSKKNGCDQSDDRTNESRRNSSQCCTKDGRLKASRENFQVWDDPERKTEGKQDERLGKIEEEKKGSCSTPQRDAEQEKRGPWNTPSHEILADCSLLSPTSSKLLVTPTSGNKCLQQFPKEEKAEAHQFETFTMGFNLISSSKTKLAEDWDYPVHSLSRPQCFKDCQHWITGTSKEHLQQDDCPDDVKLNL